MVSLDLGLSTAVPSRVGGVARVKGSVCGAGKEGEAEEGEEEMAGGGSGHGSVGKACMATAIAYGH